MGRSMTFRCSSYKLLSLALFLLALTGCSDVVLYSNLRERDANEMMAILMKKGIACTKTPGEEQTWTLTVPTSSFSQAEEALEQQGYPKDDYVGIGEVFKKSGLVSSPTEERIRFMHALSQELSETVSRIDGVLEARVHIVLPNNSPLDEEAKPSSAAVFIKHRRNADLETSLPEIKNLVVNSIEGLTYDKVTTALFPASERMALSETAEPPAWVEVFSVKLAPESVSRFRLLLGGLAGVTLILLAVAAAVLLRSTWKVQAKAAEAP